MNQSMRHLTRDFNPTLSSPGWFDCNLVRFTLVDAMQVYI